MSLSDFFPDSNGCGSVNFMMRAKNQITEVDQGKQKDLQPLPENISDGQGSISRESEDEGWYYLPRSSPVISQCQEKNMKKLPSTDSNNRAFHERSDENFQKGQEFSLVGFSPVSKMLQNILPEEQTTSTSSAQRILLLETHCAPAAIKDERCSDKQRNLSCGSSESQTSSCEESNLLNSGASQLEKGIVTCLNKSLISGEQSSIFAGNEG